ncbi:MAG: hypothetical protein U0795_19380 [Pirellulales bacterium]
MDDIRLGRDDGLVSPHPAVIGEIVNDPLVNRKIRHVDLSGDVGDVRFQGLAKLTDMAYLHLYDTQHTDTLVAWLAASDSLAELHIEQSDLSDEGIKRISKIANLEVLEVESYGDKITGATLAELRNLPRLRSLSLTLGPTDVDFSELKRSLPNCKLTFSVGK